ncbi:glycosyltransferase family 4 protein [uncultured Fibrella sp.]|uniref:glycosyltransferase family 4 protein n=1 Tax=uncultured Fibrella sp. TaxID=1284596 RepID=UPI0035CB520A
MNVLWLARAPHPAKSGHPVPWMTALAANLVAQEGISITVVSYNPYIDHDDEVTRDGVRYIFLKVPDDKWDLLTGYTRRIKLVSDYLRDKVGNQTLGTFDLLHIHGTEEQYPVMAAGLNLPKVVSAQGFVTEYYRYLPNRPDYRHASWAVASYYEKKYAPSVRHYIGRTHWDKAIIHKLNPKAVIHHNWELMRPVFYQPIAPPSDQSPNAMLFVGGLHDIKGIREALRALSLLRERWPLRLIVTGFGSKPALLDLISTLGLTNIPEDAVEHRGMLTGEQLWAAYADAFCLLHPSYIDNSPNSVCEAQLAGLPVVASDVGGVSSLVENGQTGLLTSLDPANIAAAVGQLWESTSLRQLLAQQARAVSLERFDAQHITHHTKSIYEAVLANP